MCVCYQHNSKINNSRKSKIRIFNLYHREMLHETFYEDRIISLCTEEYKRILMHYSQWTWFLINSICLDYTKYECTKNIKIFLNMLENMYTTEYSMNSFGYMITRPLKRTRDITGYNWKFLKEHVKLFCAIFKNVQYCVMHNRTSLCRLFLMDLRRLWIVSQYKPKVSARGFLQ